MEDQILRAVPEGVDLYTLQSRDCWGLHASHCAFVGAEDRESHCMDHLVIPPIMGALKPQRKLQP